MVETRKFNKELFTPIGDAKTIVGDEDKEGVKTSTVIWDSAEFTRAIFKLQWQFDKDQYPSEENDWLLKENPW